VITAELDTEAQSKPTPAGARNAVGGILRTGLPIWSGTGTVPDSEIPILGVLPLVSTMESTTILGKMAFLTHWSLTDVL
jgi:hypothetical protein